MIPYKPRYDKSGAGEKKGNTGTLRGYTGALREWALGRCPGQGGSDER